MVLSRKLYDFTDGERELLVCGRPFLILVHRNVLAFERERRTGGARR